MEDSNIIKLLHNASFDYKYLKLHTHVELKNIFDTMLAEGVLKAGLGMGYRLKDLVDRRIQKDLLNKDLQKSFIDVTKNTKITDEQLKYAASDTLILFPLFRQQIEDLKKENLQKIAKLEFAVSPVVAEMELKGVFIDVKKWRKIIADLGEKRDRLAIEFQEAIRHLYSFSQMDMFGGMGDMININSQVQLMELFNNKLGLNIPSTNDAILNRVNNPIVKLLRDYRGYAKLVSTYGENLLQKINPVTGRLHPSFLQIATATGRFACNDPNVQNIPRNSKEFAFRECFNPAPGYKIVDADFSNFEMRILADFSGDEKMINALKNELDIHSYTASLMFDKPYSNDFKKKFPELRQMAKPIGFGLMYGMGAPGLVGRIYAETGKEITVEESDQLINKFFQSYPRVKSFLDKMAKNAQKNGWSSTPAGRKRWYHLPDKDDIDYRRKLSSIGREAKNHPIQGTNADAIKYALVFAHERMVKDKIDGAIILTVHDEIACEVREDQAQDFAPALASEMVRAGELFLKKVPVVSQPFVGDVWEH
ncbi:MAG: polymerase protein [candidate division WWE3 bacterium GW2011_GWC1_47_10]|uniref:DNA polymerase I n=3 Tax=Katanobacteria TaxID=422282 RepID=A0A0G1R1P3_UNCKA|nr:MAG: polymerase protein [candidate division WWE3 bacterium GW2011_GWC1_47_10]